MRYMCTCQVAITKVLPWRHDTISRSAARPAQHFTIHRRGAMRQSPQAALRMPRRKLGNNLNNLMATTHWCAEKERMTGHRGMPAWNFGPHASFQKNT